MKTNCEQGRNTNGFNAEESTLVPQAASLLQA